MPLATRNKKVAVQRAVQLDADLTAGKFRTPPRPTTIEKAADEYIEFLKSEGRAGKTIVRYRGELRGFRDFCQTQRITRLAQITVTLFDKYRADRKKIHLDRTVFHGSVVIKQWVKWCKRREFLAENRLEDYRLEKPAIQPKGGPTLEEANGILQAAAEPRRTQYATLAFTGMRSAEMQHLLRADVDLKGNWVHIISRHGVETKTRESRKVPIHPRLRALLEARKKTNHKWFFTAGPSNKFPHGGHWVNPKRLNEDFLKTLRCLGIPAGRKKSGFTVHSLRHFFKTFCIMATMTVVVVMANNVAAATNDRVRFHNSGQFSEAGPLDKTWTTGGGEDRIL